MMLMHPCVSTSQRTRCLSATLAKACPLRFGYLATLLLLVALCHTRFVWWRTIRLFVVMFTTFEPGLLESCQTLQLLRMMMSTVTFRLHWIPIPLMRHRCLLLCYVVQVAIDTLRIGGVLVKRGGDVMYWTCQLGSHVTGSMLTRNVCA